MRKRSHYHRSDPFRSGHHFFGACRGFAKHSGPGKKGRDFMNKMKNRRNAGPYRSRHGVIFGVCKGLAEYFDFSVFWVRAAALAIFFFTGIWPIAGLYILASLIMKPEPVVPFSSEADQEFYNSFSSSRPMALHRLKRTFDSLDRRLQRMEDIVTTKEYDWTRRFNQR